MALTFVFLPPISPTFKENLTKSEIDSDFSPIFRLCFTFFYTTRYITNKFTLPRECLHSYGNHRTTTNSSAHIWLTNKHMYIQVHTYKHTNFQVFTFINRNANKCKTSEYVVYLFWKQMWIVRRNLPAQRWIKTGL